MLQRAAVAGAMLALAGCGGNGGSGGGALPDGAAKAPADAVAFVSLHTDASSDQWKKARELASRFPALARQLGKIERYRQAIGRELDLVWLDFANDGNDFVALTKPSDLARLKLLLAPNKTKYANLADDWVAIGAVANAFKRRAQGDKLDGDDEFKDAFGKLDPTAALRAWVRGAAVQSALDRSLATGGAAPRITHEVGTLRSISASARAEGDGVSVDANGFIEPNADPATFSPSLPSDVPAGALLYVSAAGLDDATRLVLKMVERSKPNLESQLRQVEGVFGMTLKDDIYPLIHGESAVAIYRGGRIPPVLFLQKVTDETKADGLIRRFGAIAQLAGQVRVDSTEIAGVTVQKLFFPGNVTIWDAVAKGKLIVTNSERVARETLAGPPSSLADDAVYKAARASAKLPDRVSAFAYGDLEHGLPFVFDVAEQSGSVIPADARANTKPLQASMLYLRRDGDRLRLSGFATIK